MLRALSAQSALLSTLEEPTNRRARMDSSSVRQVCEGTSGGEAALSSMARGPALTLSTNGDKSWVGVVTLPRHVHVHPDAVDARLPFILDGRRGSVMLPRLDWTPDGRPHLTAPSALFRRAAEQTDGDSDPWFWGSIGRYVPRAQRILSASISALAVELEAPGNGPACDEAAEAALARHAYEEIDSWLSRFHDWLDIHSSSLKLSSGQTTSVLVPGRDLHLFRHTKHQIRPIDRRSEITIAATEHSLTSLQVLQKCVQLANSRTDLPLALAVLVNALRLPQEGLTRQAVIEAATSVELAARELEVLALGPAKYAAHDHSKLTLGRLATHLNANHVAVPAGYFKKLVNSRNAAVHHALSPSTSECGEALNIAREFGLRAHPLSTF